MYIVLLRFTDNKECAGQFMAGHKEWIQQGLEDGVFLLVGGLQPQMGGAVVVKDMSRQEITERVSADPFVAENIVAAEILEITPSMGDPRLDFLLD